MHENLLAFVAGMKRQASDQQGYLYDITICGQVIYTTKGRNVFKVIYAARGPTVVQEAFCRLMKPKGFEQSSQGASTQISASWSQSCPFCFAQMLLLFSLCLA